MNLSIDGQPKHFIPIKDFRAAHNLPADFGIAYFEPKDYAGLGRIDRAGTELNTVRTAMLDALPAVMPARNWLTFLPDYARQFESQLYAINAQVGLKDVEIEFAVAGLSDVLHHVAYALMRGTVGDAKAFFHPLYAEWLDNGVKIFSQLYPYEHQGQAWVVQLIAHAYGRAGLIVQTPTEIYYVADAALACPAEGFMAALLAEIAARMLSATQS